MSKTLNPGFIPGVAGAATPAAEAAIDPVLANPVAAGPALDEVAVGGQAPDTFDALAPTPGSFDPTNITVTTWTPVNNTNRGSRQVPTRVVHGLFAPQPGMHTEPGRDADALSVSDAAPDLAPALTARLPIPVTSSIDSWEQVQPYAEALTARLEACQSPAEFEEILDDYGQLTGWVDEQATAALHAYRQKTDDPAILARHELLSKIEGQYGTISTNFQLALGKSSYFPPVHAEKYSALIRLVNDARSLSEQTHQAERKAWFMAKTTYAKSLAKAVTLDGKSVPILEIPAYLASDSRATRAEAFRARAAAYKAARPAADAATTQVLETLWDLAAKSGVAGATPLSWLENETGFSAVEIRALVESLRDAFAPVYREMKDARRAELKIKEAQFKPWDEMATPVGAKPLMPYKDETELKAKTIAAAKKIHPDFAKLVESMFAEGLISTDARSNKFPRAYFMLLLMSGKSAVSFQANGTLKSLAESTLHELFHAWHIAEAKDHESIFNGVMGMHYMRGKETTLIETYSVIGEGLVVNRAADQMFDHPDEQSRARREQLYNMMQVILTKCVMAEYELWLYSSKDAIAPANRDAYYIKCLEKYGLYDKRWEAYKDDIAASRINTMQDAIGKPLKGLYFYGVTQLGSIQVMRDARLETEKALAAMGPGKKTPEQLRQAHERGTQAAVAKIIPGMRAGSSLGFEATWALSGLSTSLSAAQAQELANEVRTLWG